MRFRLLPARMNKLAGFDNVDDEKGPPADTYSDVGEDYEALLHEERYGPSEITRNCKDLKDPLSF